MKTPLFFACQPIAFGKNSIANLAKLFAFCGIVLLLNSCAECTLTPMFTASATTIYAGETVTFTDQSTGAINQGMWVFAGGTPSGVVAIGNPVVTYSTPGTYDVSLSVAKDKCDTQYETKSGYITVLPAGGSNCDGITTVTDFDGNVYNVVEIGGLCWMKENLKTSHYNDGTAIPGGLSNVDWANDSLGASAIFDNDPANDVLYGKLYNFYAVATGKLCPTGWHIPSQNEWLAMFAVVGDFSDVLKATTLWASGSATNTTDFSALPASFRAYYGSFGQTEAMLGQYAGFWTSTPMSAGEGAENAHNWYLLYNDSYIQNGDLDKASGLSCRCVRD